MPPHTRAQFFAALVGTFLCFAVFGLFAGLAGRFLAGPLGHPSPALAGLAIFLTFAAGVTVQVATMSVAAGRLIGAGIPPTLIGLATSSHRPGPRRPPSPCSSWVASSPERVAEPSSAGA